MSDRAQVSEASFASRRRLVVFALSVAAHVGLFALLAAFPPPPERVEPVSFLTDLTVLEHSPVLVEPVVPPSPSDEDEPSEPSEPADSDAAPPDEPQSPSRNDASKPVAPSSSGQQSEAPQEPEPSKAIPMLGLRDKSSSPSAGAVVPRPDRGDFVATQFGHSIKSGGGNDEEDEDGFGTAPRPAGDGSPRSLDEAGFTKRRKDGRLVYRDPKRRFSAFITPDGQMEFRDLPGKLSSLPGAAEAARAASGQELYIKEKKQLLADTFELRMQLAVRWAQEQVERQLRSLRDELARLWTNERMPAGERRRLLFERWDECDEAAVEAASSEEFADAKGLDAVRQSAGVKARTEIEKFIRTYLPRGSEHAFTSEELTRFNADRQSRQKFEPYGRVSG